MTAAPPETRPPDARPAEGAAEDALIGRTVGGRYRLISLIDRSSHGGVYLAEQLSLGRMVAVKVLERGRDAQVEARYAHTAAALGRLSHPNIVRICEFGQTDDLTYLGMEYLSGTRLSQVMSAGPVSPERLAHVLLQVCGALDELHGRGLVHRKLGPHNIVLIERGRDPDFVKLMDFGRVDGEPVPTSPDSPEAPYCAPELLAGDPVDGRADIYSLGVILFQGLTGQHPYPDGPPTLDQPPPSLGARGLPPCVEWVCTTCLQPDPDQRFRSAAELDEALRVALLALLEPSHADISISRAGGRLQVRPAVTPAGRPGARDRPAARDSWLLPAVLLVLAAVGALALLAGRQLTHAGLPEAHQAKANRSVSTVSDSPVAE